MVQYWWISGRNIDVAELFIQRMRLIHTPQRKRNVLYLGVNDQCESEFLSDASNHSLIKNLNTRRQPNLQNYAISY